MLHVVSTDRAYNRPESDALGNAAMPSHLRLYTIGHGNRSLDAFLALLAANGIRQLADTRARPTSRRHPQYHGPALRQTLVGRGVAYRWLGPRLGGLRPGRPDSMHSALRSPGLRAYADYMQTAEFRVGISELLALAAEAATAILCAELRPWHCHRSLAADYLTAVSGAHVLHIVDIGQTITHDLNPLARRDGEALIYDQRVQAQLEMRLE